jgi:hypothetical protein
MGPTILLPRKNIESPAAFGFHLPKKYLRPRLPISIADGFSLAPRFCISLKIEGGGTMDASPCSVAGSARMTWFGSYLPERLESTDMVRLVLVRWRSDVASEEALDEA